MHRNVSTVCFVYEVAAQLSQLYGVNIFYSNHSDIVKILFDVTTFYLASNSVDTFTSFNIQC